MSAQFPVQIQADNQDANDSACVCMCHVFDIRGQITILAALEKQYRHVIAWNPQGEVVHTYDNR